jgi:hypothetical protein
LVVGFGEGLGCVDDLLHCHGPEGLIVTVTTLESMLAHD